MNHIELLVFAAVFPCVCLSSFAPSPPRDESRVVNPSPPYPALASHCVIERWMMAAAAVC